jgi:hypothetical protein
MKRFPTRTGFLALIIFALAQDGLSAQPAQPPPAGIAGTNGVGPRIQFASTVYEFGRVVVGEQVKHDFYFTNTGDAVLAISGVYPGCGCTTAGTWTRDVEPGKSGVIPLQFNSSHFGGQAVTKTTTVVCNDKDMNSIILQLRGTIWKPVEINPQPAILSVIADSSSSATVTVNIISSLDEALTLSDPVSANPVFGARLQTVKPGKEFQLIVSLQKALGPGNVQGTIHVKTSSTNVPAIDVSVLAVVQPALVVLPAQIVLPPGPLANAFTFPVTIRNNGEAPMVLSDPTVNVDGAQIKLAENQPGHQFILSTTFPAGFQAQQSSNALVSVKTSSSQFPIISIPVRQNLRPVPGATLSPGHNRPATPSPLTTPPPPSGGR